VPVEDNFIGRKESSPLWSNDHLTLPSHPVVFPFASVHISTNPLILPMTMLAMEVISEEEGKMGAGINSPDLP
jgi:hypothetical protein